MTPRSGLAALAVAFTAGLTLTLVVVDSSGSNDQEGQRVETAAAPGATESSSDSSSTPAADPAADAITNPLLVVGDGGADDADGSPVALSAQSDALTVGQSPDGGDGAGASNAPGTTGASPTSAGGGSGQSGAVPTTTPGPATQAAADPQRPNPASAGADTRGTTPAAPSTARPSTASSAPSTVPPSTAAPTTAAPTTAAPTTAAPVERPPTNGGSSGQYESMRNNDPLFNRYANVPESQISLDALTIPASVPDNGSNGTAAFRMACNYSHFSYDDPIVFPGQPGKSHFHMFFGNTAVDAYTDTNSLVNSGGGSCNGFELNRSGYWTPALLDGRGNAIVPDQIILYYKTKHPGEVQAMPQGLKMIAGNATQESFTADYKLGWSCGASGTSYNRSNRIPNNCGSDPINAYIQFPFCWDGRNLDSADHISHMAYVNDHQSCPASHPVRLPQISILLYFPAGDTTGWYLSSDRSGGFNTGPGATLHADWFGGWNEEALNLWIDGCMKRGRNCSYGQTGTSRMFAKLNDFQTYQGNNVIPMP